jgi:Leucine-rich repeat (LRR) protein
LAYAQATDETLPLLEGLSECEYLDLRDTQVTDAGLVHLKNARKLETLSLGTGFTDAGMAHLSSLTNLRWLSLAGTQVTDTGLEQLKGMSHLKGLYLAGTQVSNEAVQRLEQALPTCKTVR